MGVLCPTGLPRPGGWRRSHQGGQLGERFDDAAAGTFLRTPVPCLSCLCCPPGLLHSGLASRLPKPPPHVNRREGFCDKRGAMIALYPLSLKTSPYVPRVAWGRECGHRTVCSL